MFITRRPSLLYAPDGAEAGADVQATESAPEIANTPDAQEGTGTDQQQTQDNWEERYREAQRWGTRNAQRVAELERHEQLINAWNSDDPAQQRWAAEQLGIQLEEEDDGSLEEDGYQAKLDPETQAALDQFKAQQAAQAEREQYEQYRGLTDPVMKDLGIPEALYQVVADAALGTQVHTPQGVMPDLEGTWKRMVDDIGMSFADVPSIRDAVINSYRQTKRAPGFSSNGTAGTRVPSGENNHQNRVQAMLESLAAQEG